MSRITQAGIPGMVVRSIPKDAVTAMYIVRMRHMAVRFRRSNAAKHMSTTEMLIPKQKRALSASGHRKHTGYMAHDIPDHSRTIAEMHRPKLAEEYNDQIIGTGKRFVYREREDHKDRLFCYDRLFCFRIIMLFHWKVSLRKAIAEKKDRRCGKPVIVLRNSADGS